MIDRMVVMFQCSFYTLQTFRLQKLIVCFLFFVCKIKSWERGPRDEARVDLGLCIARIRSWNHQEFLIANYPRYDHPSLKTALGDVQISSKSSETSSSMTDTIATIATDSYGTTSQIIWLASLHKLAHTPRNVAVYVIKSIQYYVTAVV